ncbi:peptidase U32 [Endomicrobiia bacterium]|uniref:peptidase U32 family protein n=1 Tax=Endomicrobium trichonymphae TaxID=1408204 RepID=UPI00086530EB|nr:U32 family peptidase C-terminal domain-containing protein [Candidatus Endomicrobium trichonymphae]GHT04332.1 peptidase U32 [Endomicrobiia bacterium]BAV58628.1 protease [Candidatus Endomicrobium trichonymphae]GHT10267.1 peptidase U32 [Endomicrobiia bacterium]GHT13108.1 peptidase U32 [Endomicrobiia bacterium]GHT15361.1 peptidase U32 [Endomicrobiia bacterium]
MKKPELLLPAGSLSKLKTAFLYGADAVYAGIPEMSLRVKSEFLLEEMEEGISFAHNIEKKVYLTLNLFSHNKDVDRLEKFAKTLKTLNPDGIIISDPGIFQYVKKEIPQIPIHISTQANICSWLTADFWKNLGAELCVLGREISFSEVREIREKCREIKLEIFIHGSMCVSYSGRCLMSAFMASRSANQGACAHSCRWKYKSRLLLEEELRPGEYLEMEEDDKGSYVLNSKDLCLMPKLDKIISIGIDSLKIEGRNKSEYYAAQTARVYRKAIDDYFDNPGSWHPDEYMKELITLQNRGYTIGFFDGMPGIEAQDYIDTSSKSNYRNAGVIKSNANGFLTIELRNKLKKGAEIEILSPFKFKPVKIILNEIYNKDNNNLIEELAPGKASQSVKIPVDGDLSVFPENTIIRIKTV